MSKYVFLAAGIALMPIATEAQAQDCVVSPVMFNSHIVETEGAMTVKAGRGCGFGVSGIGGAIDQTVITQKPKFGTAGVRGTTPYYIAKPGYQGMDEFTYAFIGTNQYGGPMRVSIKRKVTVVP
jgi:hypothetical protein